MTFRAPALRLTRPQFAGLAAGYGEPAAIAVLNAGQLSRRRLLIRAVADQARARGLGERGHVDAALRLLTAAERRAPDAVAAVVAHPYVAAWAQRCLRLLASPAPDAASGGHLGPEAASLSHDAAPGGDLAHLTAIAAAAAARAGLRFAVTVPAREGAVGLPTLGTAHGLGDGSVVVRGDGAALRFAGPAGRVRVPAPLRAELPGWAPRREVALDGFTLAVEDVDFYRDCYPWPPRPRLSADDAARVTALIRAAWRLIVADHPAHAAAMRAALRSLVPLAAPGDGGTVSAASRLAYGSVGVAIPADPATLALLLIHEFQHMKLGGLLDLLPLHGGDGVARHCAPWRADPRPVGALLQGTYAHVGVADFWRRHRHRATGRQRRLAEFEYAYWLAQSSRAARTLTECGELTAAGQEFVSRLRGTLRRWAREPTDAAVRHGVPELTAAATARWRLANLRPDGPEIDRLHAAWTTGAEPGACRPSAHVVPGAGAGGAAPSGLAALIRQRVIDPDAGAEADPVDAAYLAGDAAKAADGYAERVVRDPGDDDAWVGLALAMSAAGHPGAPAMAAMPETVRALYARIRRSAASDVAGGPRSPAEVAAWLSAGVGSAA